jgi:hypothetical protein
MGDTERVPCYMCRIPPVSGEKYHLVGAINEAGTTDEPSRAFWTNESVKALMRQVPQPEYISACGKVRGDWRGIQISDTPFDGDVCNQCQR